ncbi:unnamed protein product [Schistocephalus solidus]|uniref:Uncharacterized protein n=1 Tax=Schistocephalus solidus TaxID=70667 RepID=A0A183T5S8_SCHSO|nr:unnamed protein product [Schistocephalus solidus]
MVDGSPPRHFQDEAPTATLTKAPRQVTTRNQIAQKLADLHALDDNATVETPWCQLRNVIKATALKVLKRTRRQKQDWFDENDANISKLLAETN